MNLLELIHLALSRLGSSRLRAFLTMLGVIIGVASVVALVSAGQGATSGITSRLQGLGTNLLTVSPGASFTGFTRGAAGSATTLTVADATAIGTLDGVAAYAPAGQHAGPRGGRHEEHDHLDRGHHRPPTPRSTPSTSGRAAS